MAIENPRPTAALDSALRWIGDLDHPFYQDERQRFVWYEASAIGFQMLLLAQLVLAGILMLVMGQASVPYVAIGLGPTIIITIIVSAYTHKRGVQYFASTADFRRSRGVFGLALMGLYIAGLIRIGFDGGLWGDDEGFDPTLAIGGAAGYAAVFVGGWFAKRRQTTADTTDDED